MPQGVVCFISRLNKGGVGSRLKFLGMFFAYVTFSTIDKSYSLGINDVHIHWHS